MLVLAGILILMLGTPSTFFGQNASFLYSKLSDPTSQQTFVRTNMDFGDEEALNSFPLKIDGWTGTNYEQAGLKETLGADVLIMRSYKKTEAEQGVFFLIMQSDSQASFHPPEVCYPAQGWKVVEEGFDTITITDAEWVEPELYPEFKESETTIQIKKIVVTKERILSRETYNERRLVIFFYVRSAPLGARSDAIVMIRVSGIAPMEGSYEDLLKLEKELMADAIPYMFELREEEDIIIAHLADSGVWGIIAIAASFLFPFAIIFYPQLRNLKSRAGAFRG
ncbi:MAG: exosortase-associated EpsI family protein [Dehalococcoidia bacterium]